MENDDYKVEEYPTKDKKGRECVVLDIIPKKIGRTRKKIFVYPHNFLERIIKKMTEITRMTVARKVAQNYIDDDDDWGDKL